MSVVRAKTWPLVSVALAVSLLVRAEGALAIPIEVAWQVPLKESETYALEVARDPGFAQVVLSRTVQGLGFTWDAPQEGVYHWRLMRPGYGQNANAEKSTFVSGSFVAVQASATRERAARISWQPVAGADRYKLFMLDREGQTRTLISQSTNFALNAPDVDMMVEVVPYSGDKRTFLDFHFNPSLRFDDGRGKEPQAGSAALAAAAVTQPASPAKAAVTSTPSAAAPTVVYSGSTQARGTPSPAASAAKGELTEVGASSKAAPASGSAGVVSSPGAVGSKKAPPVAAAPSSPTPSAQAPSPAEQNPSAGAGSVSRVAAPSPSPAPAPASETEIHRRRHLIYGFAHYDNETLELRKLDMDHESTKGAMGVGAGLWINPFAGLIVSAQGSYHEHTGVIVDQKRFPGQKLVLEEARYTTELAIGFDVLAPFGATSQSVIVSLVGAAAQLPALPTRNNFATPTLAVEKRQVAMIGGSLAYAYLVNSWGVILEGGYTSEQANDDKMMFGRMLFDVYSGEYLAILLGAYGRSTDSARCDLNRETCLSEGKSVVKSLEAGGLIGLGVVFR